MHQSQSYFKYWMWLTNANLLQQHAAPVIKYQQTDNITALFYVVNVSNVVLLFVDTDDKLTDETVQFISNMGHSYSILHLFCTRSSADADNRLDAFSGQSRSTNMVPFHMLHIVSYCNSNFEDIRLQKISWPWNGGQRSLKVIESDIIP